MVYKVLLVDDEPIILAGIARVVPWSKHYTQLIGTANNGITAYQSIVSQQPDIVICDIKMPGMDGLQLISQVNHEYPDILFIILSGYEEFDFAKRAMELGVKHYLLKPCSEHEITDVLDQAVHQITERTHKQQHLQMIQSDLSRVLPKMKEQLLIEFITNKTYNREDWNYYSELLKLNFSTHKVRLLLFDIEGDHDYEHLFATNNIFAELAQFHQFNIHLSSIVGDQFVIIMDDDPVDQLIEVVNRFKEIYWNYYKLQITVAIPDAAEIEQVRSLYKEALKYLTLRFYEGKGIIITSAAFSNHPDYDFIEFDNDHLAVLIHSGHLQQVKDQLNHFFALLTQKRFEISLVKSYCIDLFMTIVKQARSDQMNLYLKQMVKFDALDTFEQIQDFILQIALEITQMFDQLSKSKTNSIVSDMIDHIKENLSDSTLSLTKLAKEKFFMNVEYLGKLFREETGFRFTDYLMSIRIESAQDMIMESDLIKISEIAEKVGFEDNPQYFSQVFKKYTGFTPSAFKKLYS
ncbi:MAG: hypothetical protein JWN30_594 [Bacilli bacterium]|nr:hypothetical protein [Bacilli bacterium]